MTRNHKVGLCLLVGVLGAVLAAALPVRGEAPPNPVVSDLAALKRSFSGLAAAGNGNPGGMETELARNRGKLDAVLGYARASATNQKALTSLLLTDLAAFSTRFAPGKAISETAFAGRPRAVERAPEYGLGIEAYLVTQLASESRSPALARRGLKGVCEAHSAVAHFFEEMALHDGVQSAESIAREKGELGGYGSGAGAEIAWSCERFMVRAHGSDAFVSLPGARRVIDDYWQWRKATLLERKQNAWLPVDYEHRTMGYVKKLVDALPAE